jgi:hypothetical protein
MKPSRICKHYPDIQCAFNLGHFFSMPPPPPDPLPNRPSVTFCQPPTPTIAIVIVGIRAVTAKVL